VDDNGGSAVAEDGVVVRAQSHIRRDSACVCRSIGADDEGKIRYVAGRKTGVRMFRAAVKVRSCRLEIGRLALGEFMNVDGMFSRREIFDVEGNFNALWRRGQGGCANALALRILDVHNNGFGSGVTRIRLSEGSSVHSQKQRGTQKTFHAISPLGCRGRLDSLGKTPQMNLS